MKNPKLRRAILIYDGECRFCADGEKFLRRFVGWKLRSVPSQRKGALDLHPDLTPEKVHARLYLVVGDNLYGGMEAVVQALALRPIGKIALVYYLPVLHRVLDSVYSWVAQHRYEIFGRIVGGCEGNVCEINSRKN